MQSLVLLLHRPGGGLPLQPVTPQGKQQTRKERGEYQPCAVEWFKGLQVVDGTKDGTQGEAHRVHVHYHAPVEFG